jgi:L-lactate dehydrogenase complex protein LldE
MNHKIPDVKVNIEDCATLFVQCLVDGLYPEVAEAVVEVFRRLGQEVECPTEQTCCGQPAYNTGYQKEAAKAARHFIEVFESVKVIVCPSGSCLDMVRNHYPTLLADDSDWYGRARSVGGKIFEFTEYLVDVLGVTDLGAAYNGKVTYHDSCHLSRRLGVASQPRALLKSVSGTELVELADSNRCCGFGGAFSVKYADISTAILEDKVNNIIDSGADAVVGNDISCLMNIQEC